MAEKSKNFLLIEPGNENCSVANQQAYGLLENISEDIKLLLRRSNGSDQSTAPMGDNYKFAQFLSNLFRAREKHLPNEINNLGEPAWNILIELFLCGVTGKKVSVSDVSLGASIPGTTSLRYIKLLSDLDLISRHPSHQDRRITYLTLSAKGEALLQKTLSGMQQDLL